MTRNGSRARGTNPRKLGTDPRSMGTNPTAGTDRDRVRVFNLRDRALFALHAEGRRWCDRCDDTGALDDSTLCDCRRITSREAQRIVDQYAHVPTVRAIRAVDRGRRRR